MARPWAARKRRVMSSLGNIEVVTPHSAPMLAMVARSGTVGNASPLPPYSKIRHVAFGREDAENLEDDVLGCNRGQLALGSIRNILGAGR